MLHKLGAHLSIAGGYDKALDRINDIGGNCLQIFSTSPRSWGFANCNNDQIKTFKEKKEKLKIEPVYFHASYLINLADKVRIGELSKNFLIHEMKLASRLGVKGTIVHLGSFKKDMRKDMPIPYPGFDTYEYLTIQIIDVLYGTPKDTLFIIENAGNNKIGKQLDEIAVIVGRVNDPRLKVCLDVCHLYSAGYNFSTIKQFNNFLLAFDTLIGLDRLEVIHANDSKDPFNSGRDRHENIGQGTVPIETFRLLMTHPKTKHLPLIIETPGFKDEGPDKKNLDILKKLIK